LATAFVVAAADAFVLAAADDDAALADGLTSEALGEADTDNDGIPVMEGSGSLALCAVWVHDPASKAMARTTAGRSRGCLTEGG
jgi:hypothetical protein